METVTMDRAVKEFKRARRALAEISQPVFDRTLETATRANKYAHRNTWAIVGVAIAAGALIGFLAAKR
jgi:ElaB/YqjD/DUF883 family membrane-anchored ribosome-binding protein